MPHVTKLTVTSCEVKHSGTSQSGKDWTMYEVAALDEAGEPVEKQLRSWDELPLDELLEYEVEKQPNEKYGDQFFLRRPGIKTTGGGSPGARLGPKVDELRVRVEKLEAQVAALGRPQSPANDDDDVPF